MNSIEALRNRTRGIDKLDVVIDDGRRVVSLNCSAPVGRSGVEPRTLKEDSVRCTAKEAAEAFGIIDF